MKRISGGDCDGTLRVGGPPHTAVANIRADIAHRSTPSQIFFTYFLINEY